MAQQQVIPVLFDIKGNVTGVSNALDATGKSLTDINGKLNAMPKQLDATGRAAAAASAQLEKMARAQNLAQVRQVQGMRDLNTVAYQGLATVSTRLGRLVSGAGILASLTAISGRIDRGEQLKDRAASLGVSVDAIAMLERATASNSNLLKNISAEVAKFYDKGVLDRQKLDEHYFKYAGELAKIGVFSAGALAALSPEERFALAAGKGSTQLESALGIQPGAAVDSFVSVGDTIAKILDDAFGKDSTFEKFTISASKWISDNKDLVSAVVSAISTGFALSALRSIGRFTDLQVKEATKSFSAIRTDAARRGVITRQAMELAARDDRFLNALNKANIRNPFIQIDKEIDFGVPGAIKQERLADTIRALARLRKADHPLSSLFKKIADTEAITAVPVREEDKSDRESQSNELMRMEIADRKKYANRRLAELSAPGNLNSLMRGSTGPLAKLTPFPLLTPRTRHIDDTVIDGSTGKLVPAQLAENKIVAARNEELVKLNAAIADLQKLSGVANSPMARLGYNIKMVGSAAMSALGSLAGGVGILLSAVGAFASAIEMGKNIGQEVSTWRWLNDMFIWIDKSDNIFAKLLKNTKDLIGGFHGLTEDQVKSMERIERLRESAGRIRRRYTAVTEGEKSLSKTRSEFEEQAALSMLDTIDAEEVILSKASQKAMEIAQLRAHLDAQMDKLLVPQQGGAEWYAANLSLQDDIVSRREVLLDMEKDLLKYDQQAAEIMKKRKDALGKALENAEAARGMEEIRNKDVYLKSLSPEERFDQAWLDRDKALTALLEAEAKARAEGLEKPELIELVESATKVFTAADQAWADAQRSYDDFIEQRNERRVREAEKAEEFRLKNTFVQFFKTSTIADALAASGQFMGTTLTVKTIEEKTLEEMQKQTEQLGRIANFTSILSQPL